MECREDEVCVRFEWNYSIVKRNFYVIEDVFERKRRKFDELIGAKLCKIFLETVFRENFTEEIACCEFNGKIICWFLIKNMKIKRKKDDCCFLPIFFDSWTSLTSQLIKISVIVLRSIKWLDYVNSSSSHTHTTIYFYLLFVLLSNDRKWILLVGILIYDDISRNWIRSTTTKKINNYQMSNLIWVEIEN